MTEERFVRQWSDGHQDSSAPRLRRIIGTAYGEPIEESRGETIRPGEAILAGLAATVITLVLFASTVLVTTAGVCLA